MKSMLSQLLCLLLLISVSRAAVVDEALGRASGQGGHNLILCPSVDETSKLGYTLLFTREAQFMQTRTETVYWPENGLNFKPITCIKVIDQIPNDMGGYVQKSRGGVGENFVEFIFTSRWSRRMSFSIEIYTKEAN